jgi:hypothetical protein
LDGQSGGKEFFDYLDDDPELAKLFNDAMTSISALAETVIISAYDFSPFSTIVGVGGGHGRLLAGILAKTPTARGLLYDLPRVVAAAPALLQQRGVEARVRVEGGSFFDGVPGAVTYTSCNGSSTIGPTTRRSRFCAPCARQHTPPMRR